MSDRNCGLVEGAGNTAGSEKVLRDSETEWPAVKSFRGRLVLKERSIADVVLSLGEVAAPSKSGRVEWWGQCRLAQQLRESVGAIEGEAAYHEFNFAPSGEWTAAESSPRSTR